MSNVGYLTPETDGGEEVLIGQIRTLELSVDLSLRPTGEGTTSRRPSHRIFAKSAQGRLTQIGSAWTKELKGPDRMGETFLSLTLDDPSFIRPLNVSAFKDADASGYTITWRRRQAGNGTSPTE
ncbi:MAG: DUF736 domain-containing protein [Parvibaculum sp.]|uniref:DUF736 domain-containing protein n=1 Tax=Parvibaculum sp. TaxID=2024848 RepID=UPI0032EF8FBC